MMYDEIIKRQKLESRAIIDRIIESNDPKIVIVAGAGTGKTFLFNQILKHYPGSKMLSPKCWCKFQLIVSQVV